MNFIRELTKLLKEERAISDLAIHPTEDGIELIHPTGEILRLRYVPMSLSPAELSTGIVYPGGVQIAIILPEDEEVYHTFNIPLPYVTFLVKILDSWSTALLSELQETGTDLYNASLVAEAKVKLKESYKEAQKMKKILEDDRDVV